MKVAAHLMADIGKRSEGETRMKETDTKNGNPKQHGELRIAYLLRHYRAKQGGANLEAPTQRRLNLVFQVSGQPAWRHSRVRGNIDDG